MRGLVMSPRSVYRNSWCPHCGKAIKNGRAFFGSTFYVDPKYPTYISTQRTPATATRSLMDNETRAQREVEVRIAYHRSCIEAILAKAPLDPEQSIEKFEEYRESLLKKAQG